MTRKILALIAAALLALTLAVTAPAHAKDTSWGKQAKDTSWG